MHSVGMAMRGRWASPKYCAMPLMAAWKASAYISFTWWMMCSTIGPPAPGPIIERSSPGA